MTDRLCHWSNRDITRRCVSSPELINLYRRWGEGEGGGLGSLLRGTRWCSMTLGLKTLLIVAYAGAYTPFFRLVTFSHIGTYAVMCSSISRSYL